MTQSMTCPPETRGTVVLSQPLLKQPLGWQPPRNTHLILYHGCTTTDRDDIEKNGVKPQLGRPNTDFGQGFYTTTLERQAKQWAWARFYDRRFNRTSGYQPVVLTFHVDRHQLAKLDVLSFQLADYYQEDYWSFVQHCRSSSKSSSVPAPQINHHFGPHTQHNGQWYDIVCGPVSAFWRQRSAMQDSDQFSFHTDAAAQLLDTSDEAIRLGKYKSHIVT